MCSREASSLVNGDDKVEGVEFFKVAVASSMRFLVETSSLRYLSKLMMKSVILNWCMTEMSSAQSQVCMSRAMCLMVGAMELWVVKGEFMITLRHSAYK